MSDNHHNTLFGSLEPCFDGNIIRLPSTKQIACPGSFVFFDGVNCSKQLGRVVSVHGANHVKINIFRPHCSEDNIGPLRSSMLWQSTEIIQTTDVVTVPDKAIIGFCFVFCFKAILDEEKGFEACGMEMVRVLRGRIFEGEMEEIFALPFPSCYPSFFDSLGNILQQIF